MSERVRRWLSAKAEAGEMTPELWRKVMLASRSKPVSSPLPSSSPITACAIDTLNGDNAPLVELEVLAAAWEAARARSAGRKRESTAR